MSSSCWSVMKHWKRWPSRSEKGSCAPVRALAPADQPGPLGPALQIHAAAQLGDPCALAHLAVAVQGRAPGVLGQREDRLAQRLLDRVAQREADARLATGIGEVVACAGGVRAREDLPIQRAARQLLERQLECLQVVGSAARRGVPQPEDPRQHLPPAAHKQRVETEAALVVPSSALLLRMRVDRRAVEVQDHPLGSAAGPPCALTGQRPRLPDQTRALTADRQQHSARRGDRGHLAEQRTLPGQRGEVETQRPPSATITARSHRTRPGSWAERRSRVPSRAAHSPSVSPSR